MYRVRERIDPRECEHAGYEEALRERGKRPWVIFEQSLRADGEKWRGLFSTCNFNSFSLLGMAYGLDLKKSRPFDLILKHHHGMTHPVAPRWVEKREAPVKQVVQRGEGVDLGVLPIFRNCDRDARPGWMAPMWAVRDENGRYNLSWHRSLYLNQARDNDSFLSRATFVGRVSRIFEEEGADASGGDCRAGTIRHFRWAAGQRSISMWMSTQRWAGYTRKRREKSCG